MKHNMNKFIIIASLLLASMGAWAAQTVSTVVTPSASAGTLTYKIEDRVCTLTATPASGYYLTKDYITAVTSLDGAGVQSRRNAPANIDITSETLEISGNASADPSGVTTYTFVMPEDENINVTVTAEFQTLIAITPTVTLEGWTFGQAANTPVVGNNPSTGQVTITYAVKDSEKFSETVPTTVGNYTVKATVAAAREYAAGEATADFSITAKAVTATMIADIDNQTYTGVAITPALTVTDGEATLVLDTDYTVVYSDNTNAGTATATITGKGNYSGTASKTFTIGKAAITDVTLAETSLTYTGASQTVAVSSVKAGTLTLTADDYTVSGNMATTAGSYTVTVAAAEGSNFSGSKTATFSITAKAVAADMIATIEDQTYTGAAITPALTVTDGETTLVLNTDYTVAYSDNTNAGTATATITGKGNYTGTASKTFTIGKATLTVTADDLTVNAGDTFTLTFQYSGFVNNETKSVLTKEPAASTGSQDISNPGTYEITVSGGEAANYDFTYESGTLTVKRELNISFSSNEWATYYATEDLATPTGLQAYKVTAIEATEVTAVGISYIPKNVAVLLKKSESANVQESYAAKAYTGQTSTFTDNVLQGTAVANSVSNISGGTVYVLYNDEFVKTVSGEIPANRGYLVVAAVNARSLSIVIDEEATGIDDALRLNEQRTYNAVYDLQGRCVSNGQLTIDNGQLKPGLYIINGKKVFIK